jgi:hypothetical protein
MRLRKQIAQMRRKQCSWPMMHSLWRNVADTSKFHAAAWRFEDNALLRDRKILGATVHYLVVTATWRLSFGHPCCRHTRGMENNRFCQFILHVLYLNILAKYK